MRLASAEVFLMRETLNSAVRVCRAAGCRGCCPAEEPLRTRMTPWLSRECLRSAQLVGRLPLSWFHALCAQCEGQTHPELPRNRIAEASDRAPLWAPCGGRFPPALLPLPAFAFPLFR